METFQASFKNNNWTSSLPLHFDSDSTLLIIYFAPKFSTHDMWKEIKTTFQKAKIIGCSGAGEVRSA